ncbi:MAG TPA: DUF4342 domain-containing protein [Actinomycetota bacterium]|jgi:hypothetical protein|nr:DUF4342 domain-containing protein [Actinomycetota bacterium]
MEREVRWRSIRVTGEQLVVTVKRLMAGRVVRRIIVKTDEDHTLLEIPIGDEVPKGMLEPLWAGLGAVGAIAPALTLEVEELAPVGDDPLDEHVAHVT